MYQNSMQYVNFTFQPLETKKKIIRRKYLKIP